MNEEKTREALHLILEMSSRRKGEDYDPVAHEHLVEVQIQAILKKGGGVWKENLVRPHLHDFQLLFKELGA